MQHPPWPFQPHQTQEIIDKPKIVTTTNPKEQHAHTQISRSGTATINESKLQIKQKETKTWPRHVYNISFGRVRWQNGWRFATAEEREHPCVNKISSAHSTEQNMFAPSAAEADTPALKRPSGTRNPMANITARATNTRARRRRIQDPGSTRRTPAPITVCR